MQMVSNIVKLSYSQNLSSGVLGLKWAGGVRGELLRDLLWLLELDEDEDEVREYERDGLGLLLLIGGRSRDGTGTSLEFCVRNWFLFPLPIEIFSIYHT